MGHHDRSAPIAQCLQHTGGTIANPAVIFRSFTNLLIAI